MYVRPGYREKLADLQGTLKAHLRFYNKISRSHRPCNENWDAHFLCVHAGCLQTHPCLKGNLRVTCSRYLQHTYVSIHVRRDVREALGVGKFFCMLKSDLYEDHMIKTIFLKYTPSSSQFRKNYLLHSLVI